MKPQQNGLVRFIFILVFLFILLRFSPILIRVGQAMAIGVRAFWWIVIPALIAGLVIHRLKKKALTAKKSEYLFEGQPIRDVTDSLNK